MTVDTAITDVGLVVLGFAFAEISEWVIRVWRRGEDQKMRENAEKALSERGWSSHLYLASFGVEDMALRAELDRVPRGRVVIDGKGRVVGGLLPKVVKGQPGLRLVVDNTK